MKQGEKYKDYYKVHQIVYQKRRRLLDMEYTTGEMAEELGVTPKYIRDTMIAKHDAPCRHDKKGRVWLNGLEIREWIEKAYNPNNDRVSLADDEFYCVKCRDKRSAEQCILIERNGTVRKQAHCPICGARMNKIIGRNFDD